MTANVSFAVPSAISGLEVPLSAVIAKGSDKQVWIVPAGSDMAVPRAVEIAGTRGENLVVTGELAPGDLARKFKGRVVFQGNNVRDQNWDAAMFQDLGSAPASMQASKAADAFGLFPGNTLEQADAVQAYIQAKLTGPTETWVLLPADECPNLGLASAKHPWCHSSWQFTGIPTRGECGNAIVKHGWLHSASRQSLIGGRVFGILIYHFCWWFTSMTSNLRARNRT
jgi:hypothetical protein